jgi:hypothetical protein
MLHLKVVAAVVRGHFFEYPGTSAGPVCGFASGLFYVADNYLTVSWKSKGLVVKSRPDLCYFH